MSPVQLGLNEERVRAEGYEQAVLSRDVLDICEAMDLTQVIFVGHSVSGMIGALAAIQAPERFAQLILVSPSPSYLNELPEYRGGFERATTPSGRQVTVLRV